MVSVPILVINSGSSSLKFGLFTQGDGGDETMLAEGSANGIGHEGGTLAFKDAAGNPLHSEAADLKSQTEALALGLKRLGEMDLPAAGAVGHRVVHGGPHLLDHVRITPEVKKTLEASIHFAPLHIPPALKLIEEAEKVFPGVAQFACFDTTFHRTMPEAASHLPLPQELWQEGVRKYGFHGLSYASIVHELGSAAPAKLIVAHLGSGCSVCAMAGGKSVDTSMGFTPTGGVVMATRTGDLDPGVLLYLLRAKKMDADALETLLNHKCGLVGLAGGSGDIREIEKAADGGDTRALVALEIFYRTIAKTIAGYAAVLGGVEMLVFTGGIGEHSDPTRRGVCGILEFLGVRLGEGASGVISSGGSVEVRVLPSEEELQIARICRGLL